MSAINNSHYHCKVKNLITIIGIKKTGETVRHNAIDHQTERIKLASTTL